MTDLIILGLDGATWDLVDELIEAGRLPNIESLRKQGVDGTLESTFPPITGPAWLSMATGMNPGKTGVFYFQNRTDPDSFEFKTLGSDAFQGKAIWDILNSRGHSVGIFNYPMFYPPYDIDGFAVSGLGSPEDDTITYPSSLKSELDEVSDEYVVKVPYADPKYSNRPEALLEDLLEIVEKREAAIEYLLDSKNPDVFTGVISATDWVQHYFWRYHDEEHILHDPTDPRNDIDAIGQVWERVDQTVGRVAEIAKDEDAQLLIISDHGFGPVNDTFHSNTWLKDAGFTFESDNSFFQRIMTKYFPHLRRIGEPIVSAIPELNNIATSLGKKIRGCPGDAIDWDRSVAFAPQQNLTCGMLYMLSEDENDINSVLNSLKSLEESEPTVESIDVYRPDELYHGPKIELAPDILFTINEFGCAVDPRAVSDSRTFSEGPPMAARSGGHRRNGIYLFNGPQSTKGDGDNAKLIDIAPTVLWALGEPIPQEMDGNVLKSTFHDSFRSNQSERYEPLSSMVNTSESHQRKDSEAAQERLEDLGYL
ncbi:alkaline phosphatase family protein [Halosegnis rubeus]|uniref:Type I phosphodiesterase/nucleotide pyrophosphatase n=1 Tax=Halosegnis rubeus TaxID=2212850 RepID=A0A5N5UGW9_9EURY|nr:alkaline phosphatase family protein [Halosegnis rubeus]KAB7517977.1 hypothetical protein DMP03_01010 [Halosegnis rubeus]